MMSTAQGWFDLHMHTALCGHAIGTLRQYVERAAAVGLTRIAFSCHMPIDRPEWGGPRIRMRRAEFPLYLEAIADARAFGQALGVTVMTGIEGEVSRDPAMQAEIGAFLESHPFDFILGSMHHQLPSARQWFARQGCRTDDEVITEYFRCVRDGAASGQFHSMSHPDVIRLYGTISSPFEPRRHESIIREAIAAAVEAEVCWEVNTSGRIKGDFVEHPDPIIRQWALEMGLKLTLGSDAHTPAAVGQEFPPVLAALEREGFTALHFYEGGQRQAVPLNSSSATRN